MRDIKFRGMADDKFIYGSYVTDNKRYHAIVSENSNDEYEMINIHVDPETVGQFTGLKDVNSVDIYEGDIVHWGHIKGAEECVPRKAVVKFNPDIEFKTFNLGNNDHSFKFGRFAYQRTNVALEVIGNIHDNPEFLTEVA